MRLIDADATKRRVADTYFDTLIPCVNRALDDSPTVDAVPVVRCRECKHLNVVNRKELYAHCPKTSTVFRPFELDTREHFCSLGERKEGAV